MAEKQKAMTLEECAHCMNQLNLDLQRQTDAYRYFRNTQNVLASLVHDVKHDANARLPFITFHFPMTNSSGVPGEFKLDLNSLPTKELAALEPLFSSLGDAAGETLLTAWERVFTVTAEAQPTVGAARHAQAADVV